MRTDRTNELEDQVRYLAAGLGLPVSDPAAAVPAEVVRLARSGEPVAAVRELREETGIRLVAAKKIVDAVRAGRTPRP